MEHTNRGNDLIVGGPSFTEASSFEATGGAVRGGDSGFRGLERVAALPSALLLGAALALAANGERGVQAHRVHPASTGTGKWHVPSQAHHTCMMHAWYAWDAAERCGRRRGLPHALWSDRRPVPVPCRDNTLLVLEKA